MTTALADALDRAIASTDDDASLLKRKARPIRGAPFTFRTFPDGEFGKGRTAAMRDGENTLDRLVTVTLPAIDGEDHKMVPTIEIEL